MNQLEKIRKHINLRDLGGYKTNDGRMIKPGLIYRSGGIYLMNPEELEIFQSLGIKYVMDFRTAFESSNDPDPALPGVEIVRHSGLQFRGGEEIDFSPVGMSKIGKDAHEQFSMLKTYYSIMPFENEAFRILMSYLLDGKVPIVFHCATGKDRTGVFAIIILLALGVSPEDALADYMLSNDYHKSIIDREFEANSEMVERYPEYKQLLSMRVGVTEIIGRSVIDSILSHRGSLEGYLEDEFGLTEASIAKLRDMYLITVD